jgi:hypothetical protein
MTGEGTIATAVEAMKSGGVRLYPQAVHTLKAIVPVSPRALAVRRLRLENAGSGACASGLPNWRRRTRSSTHFPTPFRTICALRYALSMVSRAFSSQDFSAKMPGKGQELLNLVIANASRMEQLITDLLRFSQLGRQPLCDATCEYVTSHSGSTAGPAQ